MKDFSLKESGGEELEVAVTCIMCLGGFWHVARGLIVITI